MYQVNLFNMILKHLKFGYLKIQLIIINKIINNYIIQQHYQVLIHILQQMQFHQNMLVDIQMEQMEINF